MCYWHAYKESSSHGFIVLISAENNGYFERLFRKLFIIPNSIKDETPQPTLFNNNLLILKQIELKKSSLECINDKFKCFFYHCNTIYIILLVEVSILILHIFSLLHESVRLKRLILIPQLNAWLAITKYLKIVDQDWNLWSCPLVTEWMGWQKWLRGEQVMPCVVIEKNLLFKQMNLHCSTYLVIITLINLPFFR